MSMNQSGYPQAEGYSSYDEENYYGNVNGTQDAIMRGNGASVKYSAGARDESMPFPYGWPDVYSFNMNTAGAQPLGQYPVPPHGPQNQNWIMSRPSGEWRQMGVNQISPFMGGAYPIAGQMPYPPYQQPAPIPYPAAYYQQPMPMQQPLGTSNSFNPFENPLQPIQKRPPFTSMNPYPKQQFMQKQPSGFQSVLNQFKTQDGSFDINKMVNTAGQVMNTVNQVSAMVKGMGGILKV
ncbi:YppG family protein [Peribacillus sp. SCS-155]|uniref:YppG family protein n=1 Tax=Peribacillus sedimenti TaxID=3115297 RepID=UPI0039058E37